MKLTKFLTALAVVAPVVGTISVASCKKPVEYITPTIVCDKDKVSVSCSGIELNKGFTITANTADTYVVTDITVEIGEELPIAPQKVSPSKGTVAAQYVTDKSITITVTTEQIEETADQFIHDRTFSIRGVGSEFVCYGTAGILADATPTVYDDYKYYIATNGHVQDGIESLVGLNKYQYATTSTPTKGDVGSYVKFKSLAGETDYSRFCFTGSDQTKAIDMYVATVDFDNEFLTQQTRKKLNKLNTLQETKGYITQFVQSSDDNNFTEKNIYVGGYPVKTNNVGAGRFETIQAHTTTYYDKNDITHKIKGSSIIDISPQYAYVLTNIECQKDSEGEWVPIDSLGGLSGGSSGSMAVVYDQDQGKVVGIYGGGKGWETETFGYFYPYLSVFNSDHKDFTQPYLPN